MRIAIVGVLVACSGGGTHVDASARDVVVDTPACDVTKPFGSLSPLGGVNTADEERWGWLTDDELTLYFAKNTVGNPSDLYVATRALPEGTFGQLGALVTTASESEARPILTSDQLTLYMEHGVAGQYDINFSTRSDAMAAFSGHSEVPVINTSTAQEFNPWISADGLTIYFTSDRDSFNDIFRSSRTSTLQPFDAPVAVTELNSMQGDYMGAISRDGLELFMSSSRDTVGANLDIFHAVRTEPTGPFGPLTKLTELSGTTTYEYPTWISMDRCRLMFTSDRGGGSGALDLWIASRSL